MKPQIIGITGPAGAGKDTLASMFTAHGYRIDSFAAPLYDMMAALLPPGTLQNREKKEAPHDALLGHSPRHALQTLGTEWGRCHIHPDLWVRQLERRWNALGRCRLVIPDVRFPNEVAFVEQHGELVSVARDVDPVAQHVSENPLVWGKASYVFHNDESFAHLQAKVDYYVENR